MQQLAAVAREYDMAIVVVHHMRKPQALRARSRYRGVSTTLSVARTWSMPPPAC